MNERKYLVGEFYNASDLELAETRLVTRERCHAINSALPSDEDHRRGILKELFASGGESVWLEPPFRCDYETPAEE